MGQGYPKSGTRRPGRKRMGRDVLARDSFGATVPEPEWYPASLFGACISQSPKQNWSNICLDCRSKQYMSHVTRKPVFGVFDQVRLKPAWSATETSQGLEILDLGSIGITWSKERIIKVLIRPRVLWCLIWVDTVCLDPKKGTLG